MAKAKRGRPFGGRNTRAKIDSNMGQAIQAGAVIQPTPLANSRRGFLRQGRIIRGELATAQAAQAAQAGQDKMTAAALAAFPDLVAEPDLMAELARVEAQDKAQAARKTGQRYLDIFEGKTFRHGQKVSVRGNGDHRPR